MSICYLKLTAKIMQAKNYGTEHGFRMVKLIKQCHLSFLKLKLSWQICQIFLPNLPSLANLPNLPNSVKNKNPLNVSTFLNFILI